MGFIRWCVSWKAMKKLMFSCRAQNNFWTVARQDDRPKKFLLGLVSFLTGQNIGQKCWVIICQWTWLYFYKETKSKGAFNLSELTGQPIPLVMRISLLIKTNHTYQSIIRHKGDGFSAKPISLLKCLVWPWSSQLVLTFGIQRALRFAGEDLDVSSRITVCLNVQ